MPHTIKLAPEHYTGLKPQTRSDRRSLLLVLATFSCAISAAGGLRLVQQHWQQVRELTWHHARGTIQQVRPILVGQAHSQGASVMLYEAQVLVTYSANGQAKQDWITVRQTPKTIAEINIATIRWIGAGCTVRWNSSNPNQMDVEFI